MVNENYFGNLTESARIKKLTVSINGIEIRSQNIMDVQLHFGKENKGIMTFLDNTGISELSPLSYSVVEIYLTDNNNFEFKNHFIITKVNTVRYKEGSIRQEIEFENIVMNNLRNTYISKGFVDKTIIEMITDIFKELNINAIILTRNTDQKYSNFIFPKNISLWEFFNKHLKYENIEWYFDYQGLKILSKDYFAYKDIPLSRGDIYTLTSKPNNPNFNILEFKGITSNTNKLLQAPTSYLNKFNNMNLVYNPEVIGKSNAYKVEKNNGYMGMGDTTLPILYASIGIKEIDNLNSSLIMGSNENYRDIINSNQKFQIIVQGTNLEKMYSKIQISLPRPKALETSVEDKVFSGYFIVTEIINKIVGGVFIQVLTLQSSDYGRGDNDVWS
jgi:hypothetical protein